MLGDQKQSVMIDSPMEDVTNEKLSRAADESLLKEQQETNLEACEDKEKTEFVKESSETAHTPTNGQERDAAVSPANASRQASHHTEDKLHQETVGVDPATDTMRRNPDATCNLSIKISEAYVCEQHGEGNKNESYKGAVLGAEGATVATRSPKNVPVFGMTTDPGDNTAPLSEIVCSIRPDGEITHVSTPRSAVRVPELQIMGLTMTSCSPPSVLSTAKRQAGNGQSSRSVTYLDGATTATIQTQDIQTMNMASSPQPYRIVSSWRPLALQMGKQLTYQPYLDLVASAGSMYRAAITTPSPGIRSQRSTPRHRRRSTQCCC